MDRRRNAAATGHEGLAAGLVHRNDRRVAHEAAEVGHLPYAFAFNRNHTHGRGFLVDHADRSLVGDDAGNGGGGGISRNGDHVKADGAYAGHGFELFDLQAAVGCRVDHVLVFGDGDERAGKSADVGGRHDAALLHLIVQHGERCGGARCANLFEAENASRAESKRRRLPGQAGFPQNKTLDGYDWSMASFPADWGREQLENLEFVDRAEDLVLYGDVGCGKTHLAIAIGVLACQRMIPVRFFTSSSLVMRLRKAKDDNRLDTELKTIGKAGLAVIDEQHRFGVRQRGMLAEKAVNPHLLVMSATPIPRTLGLLLYGDLDISILDELPPGRTPVKTRCITGKKRRDLYHFLDQEIDKGRQVYLVCPAIEDTPDGGLNAVKTYYEDIAKALLPDRRVGLMHGKLKPKEKAAVMEDFKAGRLDALVSTTVIEVGVDVPNASVMVIENAERYGLSALHQLRGRVGRGAAESWCFLVSDNTGEAVHKRLKFLCSTTDGFAVAQYDLETRGPGDFFGSRQHGLPTLQIADLMNDTRTLHAAQSEALAMLAEDPLLQAPEHALLAAQVQQMFDKAGPMN